MLLWEVRRQRWVTAEFENRLRHLGGTRSLEELLMTHTSESAVEVLCQAAELAMEPLTFVESVLAMLQGAARRQAVPGRRVLLADRSTAWADDHPELQDEDG